MGFPTASRESLRCENPLKVGGKEVKAIYEVLEPKTGLL